MQRLTQCHKVHIKCLHYVASVNLFGTVEDYSTFLVVMNASSCFSLLSFIGSLTSQPVTSSLCCVEVSGRERPATDTGKVTDKLVTKSLTRLTALSGDLLSVIYHPCTKRFFLREERFLLNWNWKRDSE